METVYCIFRPIYNHLQNIDDILPLVKPNAGIIPFFRGGIPSLSRSVRDARESGIKKTGRGTCRFSEDWWLLSDSNQRPVDYDSIALPTELSSLN